MPELSNDIDAKTCRDQVDQRLKEAKNTFSSSSPTLQNAMQESVSPLGKRFRGTLMLLIAAQTGEVNDALVDAASVIEIVHAASLIVDDLPSMDNAKLRRGLPAVHATYGEDTAILTGIALVMDAIGYLARSQHMDNKTQTGLIEILSRAIGSEGLCAGQELDLHGAKSEENILREQDLKTGALFVASFEMIAVIQKLDDVTRDDLRTLGFLFGRVFQSCDDLKDALGDVDLIGKDVRQDFGDQGASSGVLSVVDIRDAITHYNGLREELLTRLTCAWPEASSLMGYVEAALPAGDAFAGKGALENEMTQASLAKADVI